MIYFIKIVIEMGSLIEKEKTFAYGIGIKEFISSEYIKHCESL